MPHAEPLYPVMLEFLSLQLPIEWKKIGFVGKGVGKVNGKAKVDNKAVSPLRRYKPAFAFISHRP